MYCNIYTLNTECLARQYLVSHSPAFPTRINAFGCRRYECYHYQSVCRYVVVDGLPGVHVVHITTGPRRVQSLSVQREHRATHQPRHTDTHSGNDNTRSTTSACIDSG